MTGQEWRGLLCFALNNGGFFPKADFNEKMSLASVFCEFPSFADFLLFPFQHGLLLVWLHQQAGWGKIARLLFWQGVGMDAPGSLGRDRHCSRGLMRFLTNGNLFSMALFFLLFCQSLCCFAVRHRLFFHWRKWICITESHVKRFTTDKIKEM